MKLPKNFSFSAVLAWVTFEVFNSGIITSSLGLDNTFFNSLKKDLKFVSLLLIYILILFFLVASANSALLSMPPFLFAGALFSFRHSPQSPHLLDLECLHDGLLADFNLIKVLPSISGFDKCSAKFAFLSWNPDLLLAWGWFLEPSNARVLGGLHRDLFSLLGDGWMTAS